jgi:hypothetical protein
MSRSASFEVGLGDPLANSGEPRPNLEPHTDRAPAIHLTGWRAAGRPRSRRSETHAPCRPSAILVQRGSLPRSHHSDWSACPDSLRHLISRSCLWHHTTSARTGRLAKRIHRHQALARIIGKTKRRTLNDVQARIDYLTVTSNIAEKDTMEAITRLMDYHDRIKATRNSALGIGVILQFLQSLLLPLLLHL